MALLRGRLFHQKRLKLFILAQVFGGSRGHCDWPRDRGVQATSNISKLLTVRQFFCSTFKDESSFALGQVASQQCSCMLRVVLLAMSFDGGPVVQVAGKRWRLDIGARQEVSLQLSSVDLPGGAQVGNCQGCLILWGLHSLSLPLRALVSMSGEALAGSTRSYKRARGLLA